jgi:uncharacterized protein YprB with RNaseH-like and TPR domain
MMGDLRSRLRRIREVEKSGPPSPPSVPAGKESASLPPGFGGEWQPAGFMTLKRLTGADAAFGPPPVFPETLAILVPDLFRYGRIPRPGDLLFFDLETTGLSGGAGTVAFLAAFGRFAEPGGELLITQYLLLDYPGEPDFLNALAGEFEPRGGRAPLAVSFNGKSFDAQILKTRFRMQGLTPPAYYHADLLHPARRLWKRPLGDCSQKNLETRVLGIDRAGDTDGALAPDIWFSFLKTGETGELLGICDHNLRDIKGLAALFLALGETAASPLESRGKFLFDFEALALWWRKTLLSGDRSFPSPEAAEAAARTGGELLRIAAEEGHPGAAYAMAMDSFKTGRAAEGRLLLLSIAGMPGGPLLPPGLKAAAFRALAVDAEWRQAGPEAALAHTASALALEGLTASFTQDLLKRRERLLGKLKG